MDYDYVAFRHFQANFGVILRRRKYGRAVNHTTPGNGRPRVQIPAWDVYYLCGSLPAFTYSNPIPTPSPSKNVNSNRTYFTRFS